MKEAFSPLFWRSLLLCWAEAIPKLHGRALEAFHSILVPRRYSSNGSVRNMRLLNLVLRDRSSNVFLFERSINHLMPGKRAGHEHR